MPRKRAPRNWDTDDKQKAFIAAFAAGANITAASAIVKVDRKQHYHWLEGDKIYRDAWESMLDDRGQDLENEAIRRAMEGVKRPMYYRGKQVRTGRGKGARVVYEVEYSDQLLIVLLKRFRPQLYREHTVTEVSGSLDLVQQIEAGRRRVLEMRAKENAG